MVTGNSGDSDGKRGFAALGWALGGLAIGIVGTVALASPRRAERSRPLAVAASPIPVATPRAELLETKAKTPPTVVAKHAPPQGRLTPTDPFGDSAMVLPKAPLAAGGLQGPILPTANLFEPVPAPAGPRPGDLYLKKLLAQGLPAAPAPLHVAKSSAPVVREVLRARLDKFDLAVKERAVARQAVLDAVQKLGGKAQELTETDSTGKAQTTGVLLSIPSVSLEDFVAGLAPVGVVGNRERWAGSPTQRLDKLREPVVARVASLRELRAALLASYKPDAGPVKDVDAQIAEAEGELGQLKIDDADDNTAVVLVTFAGQTASPP